MSKQKPSIPKGTRDFLPAEMNRREFIFTTLADIFKKFGYVRIETPAMENLSTLTGKYGEEGDRLLFRILNQGDFLSKVKDFDYGQEGASQKLSPLITERALRFDLTVPFARFVVQNQNELSFPFRRFQIQPVWRGDNPQKGRYREFFQCDCDVIGSDSLLNDAELISIYDQAFASLGFSSIRILINNRKILSGLAEICGHPEQVTSICVAIDKLDKIGEEKVKAELTSRGISENGTQKIFEVLQIQGSNEEKLTAIKAKFASSETGLKGLEEMREVLRHEKSFGSAIAKAEFDLGLARGLDYYTGTIYEVKAVGIEYGSLGGGGRYDNLTGIFGLDGMSGVGISFGADRIYDVMDKLNLFSEAEEISKAVMVLNFGDETIDASIAVLNDLRKAGVASEIYPDNVKVVKQFKYADKKGIRFAVMIGGNELAEGKANIKDLKSGEQQQVVLGEVAQFIAGK